MELIRKIKKHEMLRRWAIGEVYVEYLSSINEEIPQETLRLLNSGSPGLERKGIKRSLKGHHLSLVDCLPSDVSWYLAKMELNQPELNKLYTLPVPELAKITNFTYRVPYAAKIVQNIPSLNTRVTGIIDAFKSDASQVQLSGITFLAKQVEGPYTIIEGNGRTIGLYNTLFLEKIKVIKGNHIEVVLGLSEEEIGYV